MCFRGVYNGGNVMLVVNNLCVLGVMLISILTNSNPTTMVSMFFK